MNHEELKYARGYVTDKFVCIELMINSIISAHFLGRVDTDFVINVLNNEMSSFAFKKTILKQIVDEKATQKNFNDLEKLNRIRNLFCHGSLNLPQGSNIKDPDANIFFNDPKKVNELADPEENLEVFDKLFSIVSDWLVKIGEEKGMKFS